MRKLSPDDVVDIICLTAKLDTFKSTPQSLRAMEDLVLSAEVRAALLELKPDIKVSARGGVVYLGGVSQIMKQPERVLEIEKIAGGVPGVKEVKVDTGHMVEWTD